MFRVEAGGEGPMPRVVMDQVDVPRDEPLAVELRDFAEAARRGEAGPCTAEEGLRALELALEIIAAIAE